MYSIDVFKKLAETNETIRLITTNGFQMDGEVTWTGEDVIAMKHQNDVKFVMLSAISTFIPSNRSFYKSLN